MSVRAYGSRPDFSQGDRESLVDPALGWYFAGLVDGEGCFSITTNRCEFIVKMRLDDRPLLEMLRGRLGGIRRVSVERGSDDSRRRRPQARWVVCRKAELLWLTELFDEFSPQSKKARDYAIWREAVIAWACGMSPQELPNFRDQLRGVREYALLAAEQGAA